MERTAKSPLCEGEADRAQGEAHPKGLGNGAVPRSQRIPRCAWLCRSPSPHLALGAAPAGAALSLPVGMPARWGAKRAPLSWALSVLSARGGAQSFWEAAALFLSSKVLSTRGNCPQPQLAAKLLCSPGGGPVPPSVGTIPTVQLLCGNVFYCAQLRGNHDCSSVFSGCLDNCLV